MKPLKVLSIDFDYFQNVKMDTLLHSYPDGIDLSTELSTRLWITHYANQHHRKKLHDVTINQSELDLLKYVLSHNCQSTAPVMVANSHVHIYDFIWDNLSKFGTDCVNIVNIDMHHDMINDNDHLDCGNWIRFLHNELPDSQISWIANPVACTAYDLTNDMFPQIEYSIQSIKDCKFDIVFLCRSDNWFAPHLDIHFHELLNFMQTHFSSIIMENCITTPRDISQYKKLQQSIEQSIQKLKTN